MPIHSASSRKKLLEVHPDLQRLVHAVAEKMDLLVICGHRGKREQNEAFLGGKSKLTWPFSKHNKIPSEATDCAPLNEKGQLDWNDIPAFKKMVDRFKEEAQKLNLKIRCGADFKSFKDWPHIEILFEDIDGN